MLIFCPKCNIILTNSKCTHCNSDGDTFTVEPTTTKLEVKSKEYSEVDSWIGPIEKICNFCKTKNLYFKVEPPPSPDEPSIVKHICKNCKSASSAYKN